MIIWFALIIPIVAAFICYFCFAKQIVWWEVLIPVGVSMIFIALMKFGVERSQCDDIEYWTNYAVQATYQEPWTEEWDEWIPEQGHTETDSKGNSRYVCDVPAHWEHRIAHHPPYWEMENNVGEREAISQGYFNDLCRLWNNHQRKAIAHVNQTSVGDGGIHWTDYKGDRNTMIVLTTQHHYQNRIIASHSVFRYPKVEDTSGLFEYPKIQDHTNHPSVLGVSESDPANRWLCVRNAELGSRPNHRQVRMWILVFHNQPMDKAIEQEAYWQGGNKNEFVVCVGTNDKGTVDWCRAFSWSEVERLKIDVRDYVQGMGKLDLQKVAEFTSDAVEKDFIRREWKDFDYLTIEPPTWAVITTFIVTFILTAGICTWSVLNDIDPEDDPLSQDLDRWEMRLAGRWKRRFADLGQWSRERWEDARTYLRRS